MNWQLLLGASIISYSIAVLLQRILLKNHSNDPVASAIIFQLLAGILIGIYALLNGFKLPSNLFALLPNLFLMTAFYALGNVFAFRSLRIIDASEYTVLFASSVLWTIFGAIIFLHENFTTQDLIGTVLIIASVVIIFLKGSLRINKGQLFALAAACFFGLAFVNDALVLKSFETYSYLSIAFFAPGFGLWILNPKTTKNFKQFLNKNALAKIILIGFFYALATVTIFASYKIGNNAAVIAPLSKTSIILIVVLGIVFLKEKDNFPRKVIAVIICFIGTLLLI